MQGGHALFSSHEGQRQGHGGHSEIHSGHSVGDCELAVFAVLFAVVVVTLLRLKDGL
jgi:hypothetical protein